MKKIILSIAILALIFGLAGFADAIPVLNPFTQEELDDNWQADRFFPTGGVVSVTAFGRNNVARIGIDSGSTQSNTFRRTEGIKTVGVQNFGTAVNVDLYLDSDWENKAVRAGFWVVGDDGSSSRDNFFGIVEFVNLEPSDSGDSAEGDHTGWRIWESGSGWTDLDTPFNYDEWVTLAIELDTSAGQYNYYINDAYIGSANGGENFIRELFLNSYNYGLDEFPNLDNGSYAAHWHVGVFPPGEIVLPEPGQEVIAGDTLYLEAKDIAAQNGGVSWAVRYGTCSANTGTVAGNVDGFKTPYDWSGGIFTSSIDTAGFDLGEYCFVFNPREGGRFTRWFSIAANDPVEKEDCMRGGWEPFGFKNQGQCIRFLETGKDSR